MRIEFMGGAKDGAVEEFPDNIPIGAVYLTATKVPDDVKIGEAFKSTLDGYVFCGEHFHFTGTSPEEAQLRKEAEK